MALSTVSLTYSGAATAPFDLDISVSRSRFFRARFAPGESKVVSSLTLDELQQSSVLQSLLAAGTFSLSSVEGDTGSGLAIGPVDLTPATAAASANFGVAAAVVGVPFMVRMPFTAGVAGSPDDVAVFSAAAPLPFAVRVLDVEVVFTTAIDTATATLRSATAGAGTDYSGALTSGAAASRQRTGLATGYPTAAAGTQMHIRRSDRGLAGQMLITLVRE
jgi:hypothetical protein